MYIITDTNNEKSIETDIEEDNIVDICLYNNAQVVHRSTSISPDRIINSSRRTEIRKVYTCEIKGLKRKLSVSRYLQKKTQKGLRTLKNVLKDLQKRNLLTAEECDISQHLDAGTRKLIKHEIRKRKNLPVSRIYEPI